MSLKWKSDHVTPLFRTFQWLLISPRKAKVLMITAQPYIIGSPHPTPLVLWPHLPLRSPCSLHPSHMGLLLFRAPMLTASSAWNTLPQTLASLPHHLHISAQKSSSKGRCHNTFENYKLYLFSTPSLPSLLYFSQ